MANISVRKNEQGPIVRSAPAAEWDPFRFMRDLVRWDPFRAIAPLGEERAEFFPAFEIKETKEGYSFAADLPGVKEEDLEITITGNRIAVSGKREAEKEEKGETYYTSERIYGSFLRAFTLPEGADVEHVRAELKDGVLNLVVPKKAEAQPRKITVGAPKSKA
jgi:HSP20 family protein